LEADTSKNRQYNNKIQIFKRYKVTGLSGIKHLFDYFIYSDEIKVVADFSNGDIKMDLIKLILKSYDIGIDNRILIIKDEDDVDPKIIEIANKNSIKIMKYSEFMKIFGMGNNLRSTKVA